MDRDRLKPCYLWTTSQLAWILNLPLMNAHDLLMQFQRKSLPPRPRRLLHSPVWLLSDGDCITVEWYIVCQVSGVFIAAEVCVRVSVCLVFCRPELISSDSHMARSTANGPCCTVQQPATIFTAGLTQTALVVPLETRCSEIRKDPFHTSAASGETKGKWEEEQIRERQLRGGGGGSCVQEAWS